LVHKDPLSQTLAHERIDDYPKCHTAVPKQPGAVVQSAEYRLHETSQGHAWRAFADPQDHKPLARCGQANRDICARESHPMAFACRKASPPTRQDQFLSE